MIATPNPTVAAPVADIPAMAKQFLALTNAPAARVAWRSARHDARTILRQCRQPGYLASVDAEWDADYLLDLLCEILPAPEDGEDDAESRAWRALAWEFDPEPVG